MHAWILRSEEKFAVRHRGSRDTYSFIDSNRNMFEGQGWGEDSMAEATDMIEVAPKEVTVLWSEGEQRREP